MCAIKYYKRNYIFYVAMSTCVVFHNIKTVIGFCTKFLINFTKEKQFLNLASRLFPYTTQIACQKNIGGGVVPEFIKDK